MAGNRDTGERQFCSSGVGGSGTHTHKYTGSLSQIGNPLTGKAHVDSLKGQQEKRGAQEMD